MCFSRIKKANLLSALKRKTINTISGYNRDKEEPLYTVGTNASRIDRIVSVKALMYELTGKAPAGAV